MCSLNAREVIEELLLPKVGIFPQALSMARYAETPPSDGRGDLQLMYSP
jgi:hypothetical protein